MRSKLVGELVQQNLAKIRVRHFAPTEHHRHFDLVALLQELRGLPALRREIVIIDLGTNAHFLELDDVLVLARFALLAALFVPELAVIHQAANRRNRIRRDFHQIEPARASHFQSVASRDDPDLLTLFVDQANFSDADAFIHPRLDRPRYGTPPLKTLELPESAPIDRTKRQPPVGRQVAR
jgi:hypothetical protein